jgi:hypothetical protein
LRVSGHRIVGVKRGPIGVYFSVALAILCLGWWAGWKIGERVAAARARRQMAAIVKTPEKVHLQSELSDLADVEGLRLFTSTFAQDKVLRNEYFPKSIEAFQRLRQRPRAPELQPVIDFNFGIVYVQAAMAAESDGDTTLKAKYIKAARSLFQSLGWQDCSEENLKSITKHEPLSLNPLTLGKAPGR